MGRAAPKFNDFIGQRIIVGRLRRLLAGAQQLKEPFPHSVFVGPSGLGKTMLAKALAAEYGSECCIRYGDVTAVSLAGALPQLQFDDFLFIDEAHGLAHDCQELLYRAIDDHVVPIFDNEKLVNVSSEKTKAVQRFTIILGTDQPGKLQRAMRRRIAHEVQLDFYPSDELTEIVEQICSELNILISPQAAKLVAIISRGVPGTAMEHVRRIRMWHPHAERTQLSKSDIDRYCADNEIDEMGLTSRDYKYLQFLATVNVASLGSLALILGTDEAEVRRFIEPFLVRLGLVEIARSGRRLTEQGRIHIDTSTYRREANE